MPIYYKTILCALLIAIFFNLSRANTPHHTLVIAPDMAGKVTFRVDMRNETVALDGVFIAANFFSTIGFSNWTYLPMCDLGQGIWAISFVDIPSGLYEYKYVNGISPSVGWEFQTFGGVCTNPADNNNRFVTITGGVQTEGPFCFETCDILCSGNAAVTPNDTTPPTIDMPVPNDVTLACNDTIPALAALDASDACDANATTTTGLPTQTVTPLGCAGRIFTRTWTATDCVGNTTTAQQRITITDNTVPVFLAPLSADITVNCGNVPTALPIPAFDGCDPLVTTSALPMDNTTGLNTCGIGQIIRLWTVSDCSGNTATISQQITIVDNIPPTFIGVIPPDITLNCSDPIPPGPPLMATDNCLSSLTQTAFPVDNTSGISTCGTGQIIRSWIVTDCTGNTSLSTQIITIADDLAPVFTNIPGNLTLCQADPVPPMEVLTWTDNCGNATGTTIGIETINNNNIIRIWTQTDACGNTATASQIIQFDNTATANIGMDKTVCTDQDIVLNPNFTNGLINFQWSSNGNGTFSDSTIANPTYTPGSIDLANGSTQLIFVATSSGGTCSQASDTILFTYATSPTANAGNNQTRTCNNPIVALGNVGGTIAGLSFVWSGNGINTSNSTAPTPMVNQAGIYTVTVTETASGAGCSATATVVVSDNFTSPIANAGTDKTITCNQNSVTLDGSGSSVGTNITFQWSTGDLVQSPQVTAVGTYTITVTNIQNGCTSTDEVMVTAGTGLPNFTLTASGQLNCINTQINLIGTNNTNNVGPFTYRWFRNGQLIAAASDSIITASAAGTYILEITNTSNGCSSAPQLVLLPPPVSPSDPPIVIIVDFPTNILTCKTPVITLGSILIFTGTTPYTIQWTTLDGALSPSGGTVNKPDTYIMTVTDLISGCIGRDTVLILEDKTPPILTLNQNLVLGCLNNSVPLSSTVSGTAPFTYQWSGPNFQSTLLEPSATSIGLYRVTVTQASNGCVAKATLQVTQSDSTISVGFSTQPACVGGMNGALIVENTTGSNPPFQYSVDGGAWQDSTRFDGLKAGDYTLTIQDKEGCSFDTSFTIPPAKAFTVDLPNQFVITLGDSVQLLPVLSDPVSIYNWSNPISLNCSDCFSPFAQPFENTDYTITVTNDNGCTATASVQVIVRVESNEYAPNVFDPSSEAPNNRFVIYTGKHVNNIKSLEIYDRWGELVFRSNNYPPNDYAGGWDGTTRSKKCESGVYVFVARLELLNKTEKVLSGDVLLVR